MPSGKTGSKRTSGPVRSTSASNGSAVEELSPAQLKRLLASMKSMRDGNFRRRLPVTGDGTMAELFEVYNEIAERQQHLASELNRVHRVVGREGRYSERLENGMGEGGWAKSIDAANGLVTDLVRPTSEFARVIAGVSEGDLEQALRAQAGVTDPARVRLATLERDGTISVLPADQPPRVVEVSVEQGVQTVRVELG